MLSRFKTFDADGNGVIDREELHACLESVDTGSAVTMMAQVSQRLLQLYTTFFK